MSSRPRLFEKLTLSMPAETTERYHTFKASGQHFEIPARFKLIRPIGHGAYGVVISALDEKSGANVAIKKIRRAFDDRVDAKRILREIKLMKKLEHENVGWLWWLVLP